MTQGDSVCEVPCSVAPAEPTGPRWPSLPPEGALQQQQARTRAPLCTSSPCSGIAPTERASHLLKEFFSGTSSLCLNIPGDGELITRQLWSQFCTQGIDSPTSAGSLPTAPAPVSLPFSGSTSGSRQEQILGRALLHDRRCDHRVASSRGDAATGWAGYLAHRSSTHHSQSQRPQCRWHWPASEHPHLLLHPDLEANVLLLPHPPWVQTPPLMMLPPKTLENRKSRVPNQAVAAALGMELGVRPAP